MEKTRKKKAESQGIPQALLPILGLLVTVKTSLFDLVLSSGLKVLEVLLEQEREELCGVSLLQACVTDPPSGATLARTQEADDGARQESVEGSRYDA